MQSQKYSLAPKTLALAGVAALVVGYLPLIGFDHLHLHINPDLSFFHDHLHIGGHHHRHPAEPVDDHRPAEPDDGQDGGTLVVSIGQAAHVRPPAVEIARPSPPVANRTVLPVERAVNRAQNPCWDSRAPPVKA